MDILPAIPLHTLLLEREQGGRGSKHMWAFTEEMGPAGCRVSACPSFPSMPSATRNSSLENPSSPSPLHCSCPHGGTGYHDSFLLRQQGRVSGGTNCTITESQSALTLKRAQTHFTSLQFCPLRPGYPPSFSAQELRVWDFHRL